MVYCSQPIIFTRKIYCDFYKKKTLLILIHLTLQDISQPNLATTSIWYFCVCHYGDVSGRILSKAQVRKKFSMMKSVQNHSVYSRLEQK